LINGEVNTPAFIFPPPFESVRSLLCEHPHELAEIPSSYSFNLTESTSTLDARPSHQPPQSNLSILMARYYSRSPSPERHREEEEDRHIPLISLSQPTPTYQYQPHQGQQHTSLTTVRSRASPRSLTERTPLPSLPSFPLAFTPRKWVARARLTAAEVARAIPAVALGLLVNILDGISCRSFNFQCVQLVQSVNPLTALLIFIT
jgi:hypothetical protein